MGRVSRRLSPQLSLGILAAALSYALFWYGGVVEVHWNACVLVIAVLALIYWRRRQSSVVYPSQISSVCWLMLLLLCYVVGQLIPVPLAALHGVSDSRGEVLDTLARISHSISFAPVSISPPVTWEHLLRIFSYAVVFLLMRDITIALRPRMWASVLPLVVIASLEAALGIAQYFFTTSKSEAGVYGPTAAHGTYANRNSFTALLEMVLPFLVVWGLRQLSAPAVRSARFRSALQKCLPWVLAGVVFAGICCAHSRNAFTSSLASLCLVGLLWRWVRWPVRLSISAFLALTIAGTAFLVSTNSLRSFPLSLAAIQDETRWFIWSDSLRLANAYRIVGSGLGTFQYAFTKYQTHLLTLSITHAENDYLQLFAELGILGSLILTVLLFLVLMNTVRTVASAKAPETGQLALACIASMTAILMHSFFECNVCIPVNVLVFAWIAGIAAAFWDSSAEGKAGQQRSTHRVLERVPIFLSCSVAIYATLAIVFAISFKDNERVERVVCGVGICNTSALVERAHNLAASDDAGRIQSVHLFEEEVRRNAASPGPWCDLGEAFLESGQVEKARLCFARAHYLAPNIPPVLLKVANFHFNLHEDREGLRYTSRILSETSSYDAVLFKSYREMGIPIDEVLRYGLPEDSRAAQSYVRHLIAQATMADAGKAWGWSLRRSYADDTLARDYTNFLIRSSKYESAARAWARYSGDRADGYLENTWVFNGSFEYDVRSVCVFDWHTDGPGTVEARPVTGTAHSGLRSLRLRFNGEAGVSGSIWQEAFVKPGQYRLEAYIQTKGLMNTRAVGLRIFDPEVPTRLDVKTSTVGGTNGWEKVEAEVTVQAKTNLVRIQVEANSESRPRNDMQGEAWVDSVRLTKMR